MKLLEKSLFLLCLILPISALAQHEIEYSMGIRNNTSGLLRLISNVPMVSCATHTWNPPQSISPHTTEPLIFTATWGINHACSANLKFIYGASSSCALVVNLNERSCSAPTITCSGNYAAQLVPTGSCTFNIVINEAGG